MGYEEDEYRKLRLLVDAAKANPGGQRAIRICTDGHDPHTSMRIEAYVLEKFLKPPTST